MHVCISPHPLSSQAELSSVTSQLEDLDGKYSSADRNVKSLKEQLEEAQVNTNKQTNKQTNKGEQMDGQTNNANNKTKQY